MNRPITGFHQDDLSDWVAELSCGHGQHTRHDPPLVSREWVLSAEGRASQIGALLDCVRCDRAELPPTHAPYRRTKTFTESTVPAALLSDHTTGAGVWALIHVERGELEYRVSGPAPRVQVLEQGTPGVVLPEVEHRVRPVDSVGFYVEFWRESGAGRTSR